MTHRELTERMTWEELHHWIAFDRAEPFEDSWIQSANLISCILNMMPGKGKKTVTLGDVYPHLAPRREPSEDEKAKRLNAELSLWAKTVNYLHAKKQGREPLA